mgnify:CR=1 FL=1
MSAARIAFFTDSFHEINGVAHTSRQLEFYARKMKLPLLSVHSGPENMTRTDEAVQTLELKRSPLRVPLDEGLSFDPCIFRHWFKVMEHCHQFQPDVVHVTGPGDIGLLGAAIAWKQKIPLVASWHTNLHEYAARRWPVSFLRDQIQNISWKMLMLFYKSGKILLAPNEELRSSLEDATQQPAWLMERGIDTDLFSPARRKRDDSEIVLGYVGRLRPEKNVQLLIQIERKIQAAGIRNYRFLIVGDGDQRSLLQNQMKSAQFTGVLKGVELAEAFASMDIFLFPSWTDTYGNVITESLASGVPAVVTTGGGPKFLVQNGKTGVVTGSDEEFISKTVDLIQDPDQIRRMSQPARNWTLERSWESVFQNVWKSYERVLGPNSA